MGILLILHWLRHWNYQLIYPYGKIFKFLFIYFTNTYININLINILYLMLDEFCAWCCLLAKIAVDDLQDFDFNPTYEASSWGRLHACFVHLFDTIVSHRIHMLELLRRLSLRITYIILGNYPVTWWWTAFFPFLKIVAPSFYTPILNTIKLLPAPCMKLHIFRKIKCNCHARAIL